MHRIGPIAYKLELPPEARIYPVYHVSQLKKQLGSMVHVQHQAPTTSVEQILEPELILEMVNKEGRAVTEELIKWKYMPVEDVGRERKSSRKLTMSSPKESAQQLKESAATAGERSTGPVDRRQKQQNGRPVRSTVVHKHARA